MSDLIAGPQASSSGRYQNGTSAAGRGPVAVSTDPPRGVRTPTEVMRARRERDARRKAEQEAAEQARREQETQQPATQDSPIAQRRPSRRPTGQAQQEAEQRTSTGPTAGLTSRPRTSTLDQGQPRPVAQLPTTRVPQPSQYGQQPTQDPTADFSPTQAPEANDPLPRPPIPPVPPSTAQQSSRSAFPHAFERWESLSSHWEGLTTYWVRRLEENSNELNDRPINQQMARQITDLSAAGANLFHAVVELQRLRASSERKFQRWFFEWKQDQERAQEIQADLERQLKAERDEKTMALASLAPVKSQTDRELSEMRRELQICKEESRRAWEELGRREQEERERTISLRSGEPTLVGGVQVVPMTQGVPSRQTSSAHRPSTRDGQYGGGFASSTVSGQAISRSQTNTTLDSPGDEQRQFSYEPAASSPTETDPFTEPAHQSRSLHHAPDVEFQRPTQPPTSSAAVASSRVAQVPTTQSRTTSTPSAPTPPSRQYVPASTTNGSTPVTSRFYHPTPAESNLVRSTTSNAEPAELYPTAASDRSYIPSTESGMSDPGADDEYEINPDGSYRRDAAGRRILYQGGIPGQSDEGSDELDVASDLARERAHRERYGAPAGAGAGAGAGALPATSAYAQVTMSTALQPASSTADYSGQGWGGEDDNNSGGAAVGGAPRHRHPTRLSDILEERSGMTSPSRGSYISGGGDASGSHPSSRALGTR